MIKKFCFIVTDAISFNILYKDQLEYLASNKFELTLICGGSESELNILRSRNVGKVINYQLVRKPNIILDLLSLIKIVWHFIFNRYDLVLSTTPKALLIGSIASFITYQPRRISFFQGRVYENFNGLKRKFYIFLDKIAISLSNEVIFVSKSLMTAFIKEIPISSIKGRVIGNGSGNGIDSNKFSPEIISREKTSKIRHKLGINDSDFIILSVGRICIDKGLKEMIDIVKLIINQESCIRFIILGKIEDEINFKHLLNLAPKGKVIHVDFVNDVVPYFSIADIHLFLSHREGFGNVAIEAAAMGVPTIAFDVVGVKDSVAEGISGMRFKLGDSKSIANIIMKFINEPNKMNKQFINSREWAIKNFSNKNVWESYKNYYLFKK